MRLRRHERTAAGAPCGNEERTNHSMTGVLAATLCARSSQASTTAETWCSSGGPRNQLMRLRRRERGVTGASSGGGERTNHSTTGMLASTLCTLCAAAAASGRSCVEAFGCSELEVMHAKELLLCVLCARSILTSLSCPCTDKHHA